MALETDVYVTVGLCANSALGAKQPVYGGDQIYLLIPNACKNISGQIKSALNSLATLTEKIRVA